MLDFHTHILPRMDDGAKTAESSHIMLEQLLSQGCQDVLLTPHFYPHIESMQAFLRRRDTALVNLLAFGVPSGMTLYLGCEVALSSHLLLYEDLTPALLADTRLMLVELPYASPVQNDSFTLLEQLVLKHDITPVIAHLERYPDLKNPAAIARLRQIGCLIQLNTSAFYGTLLKNRWAFGLLAKGAVDFIASDCHNLDTRPPTFGKAVETIFRKSPAALSMLEHHARKFCASATPLTAPPPP